MAKDIDLTSPKWLALVFEGKNKEYGAYVLRDSSSDRHLKALLIVTAIGMLAIFLPNLIKSVIPKGQEKVEQITEVNMIDLNQEIPEENKIKEIENIPPPPLLKETIQFTPPVVKKDDEVRDEDLMLTQQALTDNQVAISVATVEGAKEGGVDIADLVEHKVVVQADAPKIFDHVEIPPQFPGGEKELMKYLQDNIKYPTIAQEQGIQGRVVLRFVVSPDGSVGNVEVQRSLDPSCDKEAMRVVKAMPKWNAGRQNGNAVHVYFTLPVSFKLRN
ncbi:MAG: energy transducer TonB [Candidatus Symbiothrix sp.]|jgi:protein TonB|nr:energy transducer TonB [Candidatus Symbiothrix sp.]